MSLALRILVPLMLLGGAVLGWRACQQRHFAFTPQEQALIDDVVDLYTIRITRSSDPDLARAMLDSLNLRVPPPDLDRRIDRLAMDPARATRLLQAVHDSLQARRQAFLDDETQGNPPVPRPGPGTPADG